MEWIKYSQQKPDEPNRVILLATGYFGKLEDNFSGALPYRVGFIKYEDCKSYCDSLDHEVYWAYPEELLKHVNLPN
jgi:hypothetical protein